MFDAFELRPDGTVVGLYTDAIDLRAVGHVRAERASVVDWDEAAQAWCARIFVTGEVLGPFRRREEILVWFRPLHARLQAAYFERPCPIPWTLTLQDGVDVPRLPEPHECADCFNAVYAAWKQARGRSTILSPSEKGAAA